MTLVVPFDEIFANEVGLLSRNQSWERVELGQVCEVVNGFPFKSTLFTKDEGFPVVRIRDLTTGRTETLFNGDVPPEAVINDGDLLIGMDGNFRCVEWQGGTAGLNQRVCKIIADQRFLLSKFLLFGLSGYLKAIQDATSSVTVGHLSSRDILRIPFPLPPFAEQRRIVAKLEALLIKVSATQKRLSRLPTLLKRFRQSVLAAACSGRLTADWRKDNPDVNDAEDSIARIMSDVGRPLLPCDPNLLPFEIPSSWQCVQSQDLCRPSSIITYGVLKPVWMTNGIPTVRVQDMQHGRIVVEQVARCCPTRASKFAKTTLEAGDLLIAKDGATLGKTAFVPPELHGGNITQHVLRFPLSSRVERFFVRLVVDSPHGQQWMRTETKGVALPGVNVGDFRRMPIPFPPISEQQVIVRRVEGLFSFADQIESRLKHAQAHVDRLTQSLLAKAFRGELVPTEAALARQEGRAYESASQLLERIRATKVSAEPAKRKRGTASKALLPANIKNRSFDAGMPLPNYDIHS